MNKETTSSASKGSKPTDNSLLKKDVKIVLIIAAISATIRMAVPILGLFMVGLAIDFTLNQTAFYAIVGACVGFVIAAFLIYLQIKKLRSQGLDSLINDHDGIVKSKTTEKAKENL